MRSNAGRYFDFEIGTQWRSLTSCSTNMLRSASRPRKRCLLNARKMDELAVVNQLYEHALELHRSGDLLRAKGVYEAIIRDRPDHDAAVLHLGIIAHQSGNNAQAIALIQQAMSINPTRGEAYFNLGVILSAENRLEEARNAFDSALHWRPYYSNAYALRAIVHKRLGEHDRAISDYDCSLAIDPHAAEVHRNLAISLLTMGVYERGWLEYEWRWKCPDYAPTLVKTPRWFGEKLHKRSLLVFDEQGFGDTIQFSRYLSMFNDENIVLAVSRPMMRLISSVRPDLKIVAKEEIIPDSDFICPLPSLPLAFKTRLDTIPAQTPYLMAEPALVEKWRLRLPQAKLKVGVCWQGNPRNPIDSERSFPLEALEPLSSYPGVCLISLQKTHGEQQLQTRPQNLQIHVLGDEFDAGPDAFVDAAAVIANLDLIISIDSAIAHLAGALGRPVWLALAFDGDWRWLSNRDDSPWYPTMRIFRQPRAGDWQSVFRLMAAHFGEVSDA